MNEVSPKQGMLLAPGWMRKDASQIVPPRSSDPMTEGPLCRIRREERARGAVAALVSENLNAVDFNRPNREARGAVAALVSENLNAVDFNRPNREARLFKPLCLRCSTEGITSPFAAP